MYKNRDSSIMKNKDSGREEIYQYHKDRQADGTKSEIEKEIQTENQSQ